MFLTLEDPRAKIQGSRDPLGLQPIWTSFGRRVVFNLTTVSTSVRGFTTLLLSRRLAEQLISDGRAVLSPRTFSTFPREFSRHLGETCKSLDLDPERYLTVVIRRIDTTSASKIETLAPLGPRHRTRHRLPGRVRFTLRAGQIQASSDLASIE